MGNTAPAPAGVDAPPLVLVIDDDPDVRTICERVLRAAGFRVACAESGDAGLSLLDQLSPALVVLDLAMPGTDGFAVARAMRAHPDCATLPILVFTGLPREAALRARALGVTAVCAKPVEPKQFLAAVRRLCPAPSKETR
jgi:CheY-like chemotaxis protein